MTQMAPYREMRDIPLPGLRLPTDLEEQLSEVETLGRICEVFWESAFVPDSYRRRGQMTLPKETVVANMTAAAMIGRSLGVGIFTAWQNIFINTQNRPGLLVKFKRAVLLREHYRFVTIANDENVATVQGFRPGEDVPEEVTFTVTHARAAGLLDKPTWRAYRPDLLYARALDRVCDRIGGDVLLGLPSVESLDDAVDPDEPVITEDRPFATWVPKEPVGPPRESVVARLTAERAQAGSGGPGSSEPTSVSQDTPVTASAGTEWMRPDDYEADAAVGALIDAGMIAEPDAEIEWTPEDRAEAQQIAEEQFDAAAEIWTDIPDDAVPAYAGATTDVAVTIVPDETAVTQPASRISETAWATINAIFKNEHKIAGTGQKEARLRVVSAILARPIDRGGQLTVDEGDQVIDYLSKTSPQEIRQIAGWRNDD